MSGCRTDLNRGVDGIVYLNGRLLLWGWSLSRLHGGKVGSGAEEGRKRRRSQGEGEDARRDALTGVLSELQFVSTCLSPPRSCDRVYCHCHTVTHGARDM